MGGVLMERKHTVSLCMIVKNEEDCLEACLESVKSVVDEIIIIDTGSTDSTLDIAKAYHAKIAYFQWNDNFSEARNKSLSLATKDWIMVIDADEVLDFKTKEALIEGLNDYTYDGYLIKQLNFRGDDQNNPTDVVIIPRIFKNHRNFRYYRALHEQVKIMDEECKFKEIDVNFYHTGYLDKIIHEKEKYLRNIMVLEKALEEEPNNTLTLFYLANTYNRMGHSDKSNELFQLFMEKLEQHSQ